MNVSPQVQDDMTHAICVGCEAVKRLGDLRDRGDVQFAPQFDQCSPPVSSSLNFKDGRRPCASIGLWLGHKRPFSFLF